MTSPLDAVRGVLGCTCGQGTSDPARPHNRTCLIRVPGSQLRAITSAAAASERARIAAVLRRAAAGRREYAATAHGSDFQDDVRRRFELAAACCESAADLIEDPSRVVDVIPAWRWTEAERAAVRGEAW